MKTLFFCALAFHVVAAVSAAITSGEWLVLVWIATSTLWMADSTKTHFDCFKLTIENFGLETKNHLLEKDYNKRQIRRKRHFTRLRKSHVEKF